MPSKTLIKPVILPFKGNALENRVGDILSVVQKAAQLESSLPPSIFYPDEIRLPKKRGGVFVAKKIKDDYAEGLIEARITTKLKDGKELEQRISLVSEIHQVKKQIVFRDGTLFFVQEGVKPTHEKDGKIYGIPPETLVKHYVTIKRTGMPPMRMKISRELLFKVVEELISNLDTKNRIALLKFSRNLLLYPWNNYPPYKTNNVASVFIKD